MQVDQKDASVVGKDEMQNEGFSQAESIIYHSKVVSKIYPSVTYFTMHVYYCVLSLVSNVFLEVSFFFF